MINYVKTARRNLQALDAPAKTYAVAQSRDTLNIEKLADHIASHGNTYDAGDVLAITKKLVNCMRELLLDGYIIQLGDLGTFYIHIKSRGVCESVEDEETGLKPVFGRDDILGVNVAWRKSKRFANLITEATFCEVSTREQQSENLKAKHAKLEEGTYLPPMDKDKD